MDLTDLRRAAELLDRLGDFIGPLRPAWAQCASCGLHYEIRRGHDCPHNQDKETP